MRFYTYIQYIGPYRYIGKGTVGSSKTRWIGDGGHNVFWERAVEKYGLKSVIIEYFDTEAEAHNSEIEIIKLQKILGHKLLNLTEGGEGVRRSGYKQSIKHTTARSLAMTGKPHPHKGRAITTEETREKLREANKRQINRSGGRPPGYKRPTSTCPHCGFTGDACRMHLNHFDNCKENWT